MSYSARCRVRSSSALQVALTIDATDEGNNLNKAPLRHRGENVQGIQLAEVVRGSAGMVPKNVGQTKPVNASMATRMCSSRNNVML